MMPRRKEALSVKKMKESLTNSSVETFETRFSLLNVMDPATPPSQTMAGRGEFVIPDGNGGLGCHPLSRNNPTRWWGTSGGQITPLLRLITYQSMDSND